MCCGGHGAKNLALGVVRLAQASLTDLGKAADEVIAVRRKECESCQRWEHGLCLECRCFTWAKTKIEKERCPIDKW